MTADAIQRALEETGRPIPSQALLVQAAQALHDYRDVNTAVQATAWTVVQNETPAHSVLVAYQNALAEIADPRLRVARLHRSADSLRRVADFHLEEATEFDGKTAYQLGRDPELAAIFAKRAAAAHSLSAEKLEAAAARDAEAETLAAALSRTTELMRVVAG